MFEHERALNEFLVDYLERLVQDVDDSELDSQPFDRALPPRWILGHLAVNNDYARRMFGGRFQCPKDWHRSFARGTVVKSQTIAAPSKEQLLERLRADFKDVCLLTETADVEAMNQLHSVPFLTGTAIRTTGQLISHLLTTHLATHIGQLSAWRRAASRPPVGLGNAETGPKQN